MILILYKNSLHHNLETFEAKNSEKKELNINKEDLKNNKTEKTTKSSLDLKSDNEVLVAQNQL